MAEFPALPLFTDAYLGDTQHLTLQEHGAYLKLLMIAWRSPDCALPDDDKRLATMLGISLKKWRSIRSAVMAFFVLRDGRWTQKRLTKERKFVTRSRAQKIAAGEASAKARSLKNKEPTSTGVATSVSTATATGGQQPTPTPITDSSLRSESGAAAPGEDVRKRVLFSEKLPALARAAGKPPDKLRSLIGRWLKSSGDDPEPVIEVIDKALATARADPVAWAAKHFQPRSAFTSRHPAWHEYGNLVAAFEFDKATALLERYGLAEPKKEPAEGLRRAVR